MKKLLAIAALASVASVNAAEFGVGVNVGADNNRIYAPINLSENIRLEPYFSTYKANSDDDYNYRSSQLGIGLFKIEKISNQTSVYWGARTAYIDGHDSDGDDFDGYSVAPVLGFEYFPVKNFSVGGDVALEYNHIDSGSSGYAFDTNSSSTKTSVGVKFYFN